MLHKSPSIKPPIWEDIFWFTFSKSRVPPRHTKSGSLNHPITSEPHSFGNFFFLDDSNLRHTKKKWEMFFSWWRFVVFSLKNTFFFLQKKPSGWNIFSPKFSPPWRLIFLILTKYHGHPSNVKPTKFFWGFSSWGTPELPKTNVFFAVFRWWRFFFFPKKQFLQQKKPTPRWKRIPQIFAALKVGLFGLREVNSWVTFENSAWTPGGLWIHLGKSRCGLRLVRVRVRTPESVGF